MAQMTSFQKKRREAFEMILTAIGLIVVVPVIRATGWLWCWCFDTTPDDFGGLWVLASFVGILVTVIGLWAVERAATAELEDEKGPGY